MPSQRSTSAECGVIASIGIVLVAVCWALFWLAVGAPQTKHTGAPEQHHREDQHGSAQPGTDVRYPAAMPYQPRCGPAYDKDEENVCQARRSADATERAADISWWQAVFSAITAVLLLPTLWLTRRSANAARAAAEQLSRQIGVQIRTVGPVVHVDEIFAPTFSPRDLCIRVRNIGKAPAFLIQYVIECRVGGSDLPEFLRYGEARTSSEEFISEGNSTILMSFMAEPGLSPVFDLSQPAVMWGYMLYEDPLGLRRRHGFAFKTGAPAFIEIDGEDRLFWFRAGGKTYNYDDQDADAD